MSTGQSVWKAIGPFLLSNKKKELDKLIEDCIYFWFVYSKVTEVIFPFLSYMICNFRKDCLAYGRNPKCDRYIVITCHYKPGLSQVKIKVYLYRQFSGCCCNSLVHNTSIIDSVDFVLSVTVWVIVIPRCKAKNMIKYRRQFFHDYCLYLSWCSGSGECN